MIFVVEHKEPIENGFKVWHKDEDRIEAADWTEAEFELYKKYKGDPNYSIYGQLRATVDEETGIEEDFDNLN